MSEKREHTQNENPDPNQVPLWITSNEEGDVVDLVLDDDDTVVVESETVEKESS
jgi:hypothetical protein